MIILFLYLMNFVFKIVLTVLWMLKIRIVLNILVMVGSIFINFIVSISSRSWILNTSRLIKRFRKLKRLLQRFL